MAASVLRTEDELPSTRLLTLPSTFRIEVWIYSPDAVVNQGGLNSNLVGNLFVQDGGLDDELYFYTAIEDVQA